MIKRVKRGALQVGKQIGLFAALRRSEWRRSRLTILCYHGVSLLDEHGWNPSYYMRADAFEERLRMVSDGGYPVVRLDEGLRRLREGTLARGSVALTFDDGMYDFYVQAAPLLEKYGMPATVYLTTFYSDFNRPVFGVFCSYVLWKGRRSAAHVSEVIPGAADADLHSSAGRARLRRAIDAHTQREGHSAEDKDAFAERLARHIGVDYDDLIARRVLHVMNNDEVVDLARRGFDFQLHTHRHRTPNDRVLFLREIDDNRRRLRDLAGGEPTHFCYPSGLYRSEFLPWLHEAGVASATTCDAGLATAHTPSLLLPRVVDGGQLSPIEFEGWLSGASAFLPRRPAWADGAVRETPDT